MKLLNGHCLKIAGLAGTVLLLLVLTRTLVLGQPTPVVAIARAGTNQFSITITNGVSTGNYELWWTPVLTDPLDNPWTMAAAGNPGQTNFVLPNWGFTTVFFRGLLDTNAIPLWKQSNPDNPPSPILNVTILSPANGLGVAINSRTFLPD